MKAECSDPRPLVLEGMKALSNATNEAAYHSGQPSRPLYSKCDIVGLLADRQQRCLRHVKRFGTSQESIRRCFLGRGESEEGSTRDENIRDADGGAALSPLTADDRAHTFDYEADLLKIQAPMVRCSRPPFRKLCRLWGTDISYTHMILADCFVRSEAARQVDFALFANEDRLITQFAAKSGPTLAKAAAIVAPYTDGIDINCGCPQKWAMKDGYGSALLEKPELVADMVSCVANSGAGVPCVVKMRVYEDLRTSVEFAQRAERAGAAWLTVHGRTPQCSSSSNVRHEAIKLIRENVSIPVVANGGVRDPESAIRLALEAGVGGVMSAQGLLDNPAAFDKRSSTFGEVVARQWDAMPVLGATYKQHQREAMAAGLGFTEEGHAVGGNTSNVVSAQHSPSDSKQPQPQHVPAQQAYWDDCYTAHFSLNTYPNTMPAKHEMPLMNADPSIGTTSSIIRSSAHFHTPLADVPPLGCLSDFCRLSLLTELPYKTTQHHLLLMAHKLLSPAERIYISEQPSVAGIIEYMRTQGLYVPSGRFVGI